MLSRYFIYFSLDVLYCAGSAFKSCNCLGIFILKGIIYSIENMKNAVFSHFVFHIMNEKNNGLWYIYIIFYKP